MPRQYLANLNRIERDFLGAPESKIEKPDGMRCPLPDLSKIFHPSVLIIFGTKES